MKKRKRRTHWRLNKVHSTNRSDRVYLFNILEILYTVFFERDHMFTENNDQIKKTGKTNSK